MIEVVQVGTYINRENRKYRVQCWRCNAIFRFDKEDSLYDPFEYGRYIRCPQCHAMTEDDNWIENETKRQDSIDEHSVYPVKKFKIELDDSYCHESIRRVEDKKGVKQ